MRKSTHFRTRAWESGINQFDIDRLIRNIKINNRKTFLIFSKNKLKEIGLKEFSSSNLIVVVKEKVLITIYAVKDLFYYLRTLKNTEIKIIN